MKTRNVDLENTLLLTNNICKKICLKAPSLLELKKKIKEYELLLIRCLTNAYQLSKLSLDKNGTYTILPDGNYQTSIFLNFSGIKKDEITNPEKTLQYVKHLTAMESKSPEVHISKTMPRHQIRDYHKSITVPIDITSQDALMDVVSDKQRQILEQLVTDKNLIKISFFIAGKNQKIDENHTTISLKVEYDYRDILEIPVGHSEPDEQGNR